MVCGVEGESLDVVGIRTVTDETARRMRVETDHEKEREVMGIPEGFEALVTNLVRGGGIHEDHDEKHEVACDSTSLCRVDVKGKCRPDLW